MCKILINAGKVNEDLLFCIGTLGFVKDIIGENEIIEFKFKSYLLCHLSNKLLGNTLIHIFSLQRGIKYQNRVN